MTVLDVWTVISGQQSDSPDDDADMIGPPLPPSMQKSAEDQNKMGPPPPPGMKVEKMQQRQKAGDQDSDEDDEDDEVSL